MNASAGLVLDVPRWPQLTADVYQIAIHDRIAPGNVVTDTSIVRLMAENGLRGVGGGSFFTNAIDTRTRGVDVVARHAVSVGSAGVLQLMAGYNHTRTEVTHVLPPPAPLARFGSVLFTRTDRGTLEQGQPRETMLLNASYHTGPLELALNEQRSGPTAQLDQVNPAADQVVSARWITDARIAYQLHPRLQVALSATNLFDIYPDAWLDFRDGLQARGPSMQGIFRYPGALSPFGMNGRTLYLQLAYR